MNDATVQAQRRKAMRDQLDAANADYEREFMAVCAADLAAEKFGRQYRAALERGRRATARLSAADDRVRELTRQLRALARG